MNILFLFPHLFHLHLHFLEINIFRFGDMIQLEHLDHHKITIEHHLRGGNLYQDKRFLYPFLKFLNSV